MDRELNINANNRSPISNGLKARVLARMGVFGSVKADLAGLRQVYAAWCRSVPFDNIRKMISLREGKPLAGLEPDDFFENWLENGTSGTCWPSSNALHALLVSLGFDARRVAGSMFDMGMINHGTVVVKIDGRDWMCDTGMLTKEPLPLNGEIFIGQDPTVGVELEPLDAMHMIWIDFVPVPDYVPCRLMADPVGLDLFRERYETFSREMSPFNQRLYFRRSGPAGASTILGNTLFSRGPAGLNVREFTGDELCEHLVNAAGVSAELVERWVASGSLESTLNPTDDMPRPEINGKPPSMR